MGALTTEIKALNEALKPFATAIADGKGNISINLKLHAKLVDDVKRLRRALKPFADAVYNDNGDMSVRPCHNSEHYYIAYWAMRGTE